MVKAYEGASSALAVSMSKRRLSEVYVRMRQLDITRVVLILLESIFIHVVRCTFYFSYNVILGYTCRVLYV